MMRILSFSLMKHLPLLVVALLLVACVRVDTTNGDPASSAPSQVRVEWQTSQTGTGTFDMPISELSLVDSANGTVYFRTTCDGTVSPERVEGENLLAMLCWWAGGGERFTAVKQGNTFVIRNQQVDEVSGYGEWMDIETIEL